MVQKTSGTAIRDENDSQTLTDVEGRALAQDGREYGALVSTLSGILNNDPRYGRIEPEGLRDHLNYVGPLIMSRLQSGDLDGALGYLNNDAYPFTLEEGGAIFTSNGVSREDIRDFLRAAHAERQEIRAELASEGASRAYINAVTDRLAETYSDLDGRGDLKSVMREVANTGEFADHDRRIAATFDQVTSTGYDYNYNDIVLQSVPDANAAQRQQQRNNDDGVSF